MCPKETHVGSTIIHNYEDGTKDVYIKHELLGCGAFAVVYRITDQKTKQDYAMKVISKENYEGPKAKKHLEKLEREIEIQKSLDHPNIVKSYGSFSDDLNYYIILEYCPGGSVRSLTKKREKGYLSESETQKILNDVINGLMYLHKNHIVHRDLKLSNYMIGSDGNIKIADFGFSIVLEQNDEKRFSICGTPEYVSPELVQRDNKGHSYEVDIWAIGVSAFALLTGQHPFDGSSRSITFENIRNCDYQFPSDISISYDARDFIARIFIVNPKRRPTVFTIANHPFLVENNFIRPNNDTIFNKSSTRLRSRPHIPLPPKDNPLIQKEDEKQEQKKINITIPKQKNSFKIPKCFVSRYRMHKQDLVYLLYDGSIGACFEDESRIIMDPNELFAQFYKNYDSDANTIDICAYLNTVSQNKHDPINKKIKIIMRFSKKLKKNQLLYEIPENNYDPSIPLHNVKYFLYKNDTILFRFSNKYIQANFIDHKKLIILTNQKKMCIVKHIYDDCRLLSLKKVSNLDKESKEYKKLLVAKEMLSELPESNVVVL